MKHYICLEENQIIYVCGTVAANGFRIARADKMPLSGSNREKAVREFAARNKLAGKRVILALDSGIFFSMLDIPEGKSKHLKEMVFNELTYSVGKGQPLLTCSVPYKKNTDNSVAVLAFAMLEQDFETDTALLKQAGIKVRKAYVLSNCMGQLAAMLYPDRKMMIMVEAGEDCLRILLIEDGCCVLARTIRLNVRHFCDTGAYGLLYDEISEQVSKAIQFHKSRNKSDEIETVILLSALLPDKQAAALAISDNLSLVCEAAVLPVLEADGSGTAFAGGCYQALAAMAKYHGKHTGTVNLLSPDHQRYRRKEHQDTTAVIPLPLMTAAVCTICLIATGFYFKLKNYENQRTINTLHTYIEAAERDRIYQEAITQLKEVRALDEYESVKQQEIALIQSGNRFHSKDYLAVKESLSGSMTIKGMKYGETDNRYEVEVLAASPEEFPALIERLQATGRFAEVFHNYWEQVAISEDELMYRMIILAVLGEGELHETE